MVLAYQTRLSKISYGEVAFNGTYVPNPTFPNNLWRSRLVWSRARDWKSRNRQKRFKSSNLFFSATERQSCETRRVAFFLCSQPCFTRVCEHKKSKNAKHCRIAYDGRRPAEQRDVRCKATTYVFFSRNRVYTGLRA